jgi:DNA-binding beta-propeller fold protein YncE
MASGPDRSPVDLALAPDGSWLATANQTSDSVSLVRARDGALLAEVSVGRRPEAIVVCPDGRRVLVSCRDSGELHILEVAGEGLRRLGSIAVGGQPHGLAVPAEGDVAYVALSAASQVAVVSLPEGPVVARIDVGRWPRFLAVSPDGSRLAVGTSGERGVSVVDTRQRKLLYLEKFVGLNIGHLQISREGNRVWFPWVVYRQNPITVGNIRLGWVLATRLGRVRLDGPARREAISLDPSGRAVADPHGLALTSDETQLVISASGTHELLRFRASDLPFQDFGGTDHLPHELRQDNRRFARLELGGRPLGLRIAPDDRTVYVANYLLNSVQVVDLKDWRLVQSIPLGGTDLPSLARRGEAIFYDAGRSLDQWYSCHTCHYEGGTNSVAMDTHNDGSAFTFKTVLPLEYVVATPPWTWHGWQHDLHAAMRKSITSTLQGEEPTDADVEALIAYLKTLALPPNPFANHALEAEQALAAQRGREVFYSDRAGCAECHRGPLLTDGEVHDVGLGSPRDRYEGFNTPSLRGLYRKVLYLHDGRSTSLRQLLAGPHSPARVSGRGELNEGELNDLIAYLKTL